MLHRHSLFLSMRRSLFIPAALMLVLARPAAALDMDKQFTFDIPPQKLSTALLQFSHQAGVQVVVGPEVTEQTTDGISGKQSIGSALARLLQTSGLSYALVGESSIAVGRPQSAGSAADGRGAQDGVLSLAQAGTPSSSEEGQGDDQKQTVEESKDYSTDSSSKGIPEILVRGSRSLNVDIQRTEDDALPYVTFDSKEIEKSGATNLEDFFRKRMPMNTQVGSNTQDTSSVTGTSNVSQINLRGLGTQQTLILVDGRRAPRVLQSSFGTFTQTDINGIPLSAVERIEILPSTAGGIYGGSAVGGVINIIRKRDYSGFGTRVGYDGTFRGGGETFRAEVNGGFSLGNTQISFSASHSDSQPLLVSDNDLWRRARERYYSIPTNALIPLGYTPNIQASPTSATLVLKQSYGGTSLNSNHTFVPVGYLGVTSDGGQALINNAGRYNLDLANDAAGAGAALRTNPRVQSAKLNIRHSFGSQVDVFADLSAAENVGRSISSVSGRLTLPASATNNPFQQTITVQLPRIGLERPVVPSSLSLSGTGGVIARMRGDWTATAEYNWSSSRTKSSFTVAPLNSAVTAAQLNGALNPIRDVNAIPFDYSPYLLPSPNNFNGPSKSLQALASARISGSVFELPGGRVSVTSLLEHREERAGENKSVSPFGTEIVPSRAQRTDSGYLELRAPLFSDRNALFLMRAFEFQASVRHDRYTTRVASPNSYRTAIPPATITYSTQRVMSTDYTLATRWSPAKDLSFRASYSTGFLPPSINQLVPFITPGSTQDFIQDPRRNNQLVGTDATFINMFSGNPNLQPENSKSVSFGTVLTPAVLPGFRFSIDYSRIRKSDEIGNPPADLATLEANYPGRVVRGPLTSTDMALGYTGGPITILNRSSVNIAQSSIKAWDFQADYSFDTVDSGSFRFYSVATHQTEFRRQLLPTTAPFDTVDYNGGPLKWRGNVGVDWTLAQWDLGWNVQYYNSYSIKSASNSTTLFPVMQQGAARIPSQVYHDLDIRYRLDPQTPSLLSDLEVSLGIQNIFDQKPPVIATSTVFGTYSFYGDPRLRRYTLTLNKSFRGN